MEDLEWKKKNWTRVIGRIYHLDLGASVPVSVKPIQIKDGILTVEYLNSTPGRVEEFTTEEFSHFSGMNIDKDGFIKLS